MNGRHLAYPFHIGTDGRSATPADLSEHIRGEIIQLLLTAQGERSFLPSFGALSPMTSILSARLTPMLRRLSCTEMPSITESGRAR